VFGAEQGVDPGSNDEVILVKAVDCVCEQGNTELSPAHEQVGMVALAFRDLTEPVGQRKCLSEVFHLELALKVVAAYKRPVRGYLSSQALHSFCGERRHTTLAGNALPPGEVLSANRFVVHVAVPSTM
jgi:hypothetical protein